jgi:predicted component of type VI protein secretion system
MAAYWKSILSWLKMLTQRAQLRDRALRQMCAPAVRSSELEIEMERFARLTARRRLEAESMAFIDFGSDGGE